MDQQDAYPPKREYPQEDEYLEEGPYPEGGSAAIADGGQLSNDAAAEPEEEMDAEAADRNRDVALYEGDEGIEEGFAGNEEEEGEFGDDTGAAATYDITNPYYFRQEIQRIEQCETVLSRGLASMPKQELDDETRINLLDICADLDAEEEALFSPIPECVATVLQKRKKLTGDKNRNVQPHEECRRGTSSTPSRFSQEQRAFVDPSVPLEVPFSPYRFKKEHPEGSAGRGVYHDLFFGDGSQCQFLPPPNNKRQLLEQEKAAHAIKRHPKPVYDPAPLRTRKVPKDFVPSCAIVDHSEAQRKLRDSQGPFSAKKKTARS